MTDQQKNRMEDLYDEGISTYLDKTDFDVTEWLDEKAGIEYCTLYNMQFTDKNCSCGTHEDWK